MARRRRSRARENPSAGFWVAVAVGVVAVGGVAYVMTRPAAAATPLPPANPTHPTNDAATRSVTPASPLMTPAQTAALNAALNQQIAAGNLPGGTPLTYMVNGHAVSAQYVSNPANLAGDVHQALIAASSGHGAGREGEAWVARAKVDGAGANELDQLRSAGYAV
jgi:hypothetical protein